jgi:hypothetical protein
MEKLETTVFKTDRIDERFYIDLFNLFTKSIPLEFLDASRVIPFSIVRLVLSWYRLGKKETNLIMRKWAQLGFVEIVKFKGIKLCLNGDLSQGSDSNEE